MRGSPRRHQIAFILLFAVCAVQVAWWVVDEVAFVREVRDQRLDALRRDEKAARDLLARGMPAREVAARFARIEVSEGTARLMPDAEARVADEAWHRIHRFLWEGPFFLVILCIGMVVIYRALAQQAELVRQQENFMAAVSHELKSPLASIKLAAETVALRGDAEGVQMGRILEDAERLEGMVSNILETSRFEGGVKLAPESVGVAEVVGRAVADVERRAERLGVRITSDVASDLAIHADPEAARTVIQNLLDNAAKAVAAARSGAIDVSARRANGVVALTVRDDGVGFDPDEASRLFEKFYRTGDEMRRTQPGSGLGLYIVRRLVELHGGSVAARSKGKGQGAEFTVSWPQARGAGT